MTNELEIVKHDIDWLQVIKLALDRQGWGKTYVLYKCGDVVVKCYMQSFDFVKNVANFYVVISYVYKNVKYDESEWHNTSVVEYYMNNFTVEDFKRVLYRRLSYLLESTLERNKRRDAQDKYEKLRHYNCDFDYDAMKENLIAFGLHEDYENIQNITDADIRNDCLERLGERVIEILNTDYNDKISQYMWSAEIDMPDIKTILAEVKMKL
jgi:hypothetical protein